MIYGGLINCDGSRWHKLSYSSISSLRCYSVLYTALSVVVFPSVRAKKRKGITYDTLIVNYFAPNIHKIIRTSHKQHSLFSPQEATNHLI
jgi:hypothetical protein